MNQIEKKFSGHKASEKSLDMIDTIRLEAISFYTLLTYIPEGREKSIALTKLEECVMWANKAVVQGDPQAFPE